MDYTISYGWSPRYAHLVELDQATETYDLPATNDLITGKINILKAIVEDYQDYLAKREAAAVKPPNSRVHPVPVLGEDLF